MGKKKVEVKLIQNPTSRHSTFYKRKGGLLKKAFELSVLCDVEVALIIFSETGRIYEFASHDDVTTILTKYRIQTETARNAMSSSLQDTQCCQLEVKMLQEKIEKLEKTNKNMVGENLESLTLKELQQLEKQLEMAIKKIFNKKRKIISRSCQSLLKKVRSLEEKNSELLTKLIPRADSSTSGAALYVDISMPKSHSGTKMPTTPPASPRDSSEDGDNSSSETQ